MAEVQKSRGYFVYVHLQKTTIKYACIDPWSTLICIRFRFFAVDLLRNTVTGNNKFITYSSPLIIIRIYCQ